MTSLDIRNLINCAFDMLDEKMKLYVVMNKYDELPDTLPSDIDIAISNKDFANLDRILGVVANKTGLVITQKIWHNYKKCAYILMPLRVDEPFRLQLDFLARHYNIVNPFEDAKTNNDPHGVKANGKINSFIRFMFYNVDFVLGGFADKKAAVKKRFDNIR